MATRAEQAGWSSAVAATDPLAARLFAVHGPLVLGSLPSGADRFGALSRSICFQQLAGAAASTIWSRVEVAVGGRVTARSIVATPFENLRSAGLSNAKANTIVALATEVLAGTMDLSSIGHRPDEAVIEELTVVKGIGRWTAEMFLMFTLHRRDVWPTGDFGVRMGYGMAVGATDPPTATELVPLGERFRPYRTVMAWWCWQETTASRQHKALPIVSIAPEI